MTKLPAVPSSCSQAWLPNLDPGTKKKNIIVNGQWLNNKVIQAAQTILRQQFPNVGGLQSSILVESGMGDVIRENSAT